MKFCSRNNFLQILVILAIFCFHTCQKPEQSSTPAPKVRSSKPEDENTKTKLHARQIWIQADKDFKAAISSAMRKVLPTVLREVYKKDISSGCLTALLHFTGALKKSKLWAFKLLDSSGRFPEGFFAGTLTSLGNYEECTGIHVNETKFQLKGQYCNVNILLPLPIWKPFSSVHHTVPELRNVSAPDTVITFLTGFLHNLHVTTIKVGACLPSTCTLDDVNRLVQIIPEKLGINWKFEVNHCETKESVVFTNAQIAILYIIGAISLLVVLGTITDIIWKAENIEQKHIKGNVFHVLKSFSFISNAKNLSNFKCPQDDLGFVYGIVFFVFLWNVMSNTFMYVNYDMASNLVEAIRLLQNLFYEIALNRVLPLQAFLYLTGFVTAYNWLKSSETKVNVWKFLFNKYLRYTPTYLVIIALAILSICMGSGPSWNSHLKPVYDSCTENWFYNILYINNYVDSTKVCMNHTWVVAAAAQLYLISLCVLIPLKKSPKIGLLVNLVLIVASLAAVSLTNVYYDLTPGEMGSFLHSKDREFYASHSYYRIYTHMCHYFTGTLVAYLMVNYPNLKISKITSTFLWLTTLTAVLAAFTVVHEWREGTMPTPLIGAVYASFSKIAEACFLSWLTVACMTGNGGAVKDVLSWRPFAFLSRLTFIAYIIHVPIIKIIMSFRKSHLFISELEIFYTVLSYAAATYIVSYILYNIFEAPLVALTDVVRKRSRAKSFSSPNNVDELMTQKPVKYLEKLDQKNNYYANTFEKSNC